MNEDSTPRARFALIGVRSAIPPCQTSTRLRVMALRLILGERRQDVVVDHVAIAGGGAGPPRQFDDDAPLLDQVGNTAAPARCDGLAGIGLEPHPAGVGAGLADRPGWVLADRDAALPALVAPVEDERPCGLTDRPERRDRNLAVEVQDRCVGCFEGGNAAVGEALGQ